MVTLMQPLVTLTQYTCQIVGINYSGMGHLAMPLIPFAVTGVVAPLQQQAHTLFMV